MKTVAIAAAGVLVGAAISYILSAATIRRLRSRLRAKHSTSTPRKGIGAMNLILAVVGVTLISFTIAMIQIYRETGGVPDTLITCVFAVCGGECGVMGWIKTTKERNQDRQWQQEDIRNDKQRESGGGGEPPGDRPRNNL